MNLKAAYLCIDCDSVWEPQGPIISCPRCTSSICVPLAAWVAHSDDDRQGMREGRPTRAAEEGEQEIYAGHERAEGGVMSDFSPDAIAHCSVHGRFSINDSPGGCPDCPEPEEDFLLTDEELEACEERAIKVVALEILEA